MTYRVAVTEVAVYFVDAYSPAYAIRQALRLAATEERPAYRLESSADAEVFEEEAACPTTER